MDPLIICTIITIIFSVIGWLLSNKDDNQGKEMASIKSDHEKAINALRQDYEKDVDDIKQSQRKDEDKLTALELKVAGDHYNKDEVKSMFDSFKLYLDQRFNRLENSIDRILSYPQNKDHIN